MEVLKPGTFTLHVEIRRGSWLESAHEVVASICTPESVTTQNRNLTIFPRSSIKMLQALPLAQVALQNNLALASQRLAFATASHWGEAQHITMAEAWMAELNSEKPTTVESLHCGSHRPYSETAADELARTHSKPTRLHNNCSGKHLGFIQLSRWRREESVGYHRLDHPCQQRILEVLQLFSEASTPLENWGIDGCGIPTWQMRLEDLARAIANFATLARAPGSPIANRSATLALAYEWGPACREVFAAMTSHPELIGGSKDYSSRKTAESRGQYVVKVGAEGVMICAHPEVQTGVALKVLDGAERAAEAAMTFILSGGREATSKLLNWAGEQVGEINVRRP
jgi:L-asparaginase II